MDAKRIYIIRSVTTDRTIEEFIGTESKARDIAASLAKCYRENIVLTTANYPTRIVAQYNELPDDIEYRSLSDKEKERVTDAILRKCVYFFYNYQPYEGDEQCNYVCRHIDECVDVCCNDDNPNDTLDVWFTFTLAYDTEQSKGWRAVDEDWEIKHRDIELDSVDSYGGYDVLPSDLWEIRDNVNARLSDAIKQARQ